MVSDDFDTLDALPTSDGKKGKLLANRYKIIRKLGEGGMGLVYLAEDTELGNNKVAIKFIPPQLAGNARAVKSLMKEAQTAMQLSHPNVVRLHDLHTDGHQKFLVMEHIEGKTLEQLLAEKDDDKLTLEELLPIAEQVAAGLDHAHGKNVLHRDLKPSNIMIAKQGTVKLVDFGIARQMKDSYTCLTGKETSGTLPYMSPEQLMGEEPTIGMDIYSLGAVLYECLSGHPPFYRGDIREQIKSKIPGHIKEVDERASQAIRSGLAKKATQRPKSAREFIRLLKGERTQKSTKVSKSPMPARRTTAEKLETPTKKKHSIPDLRRKEQLVVVAGAVRSVENDKTQQKEKAQSKSTYYSDKRRVYIFLLATFLILLPLFIAYCYLLWIFWLIAGGWISLARHRKAYSPGLNVDRDWTYFSFFVQNIAALTLWPLWYPFIATIAWGAMIWLPAFWAITYYFSEELMAKDISEGNSVFAKPILVGFNHKFKEPQLLPK